MSLFSLYEPSDKWCSPVQLDLRFMIKRLRIGAHSAPVGEAAQEIRERLAARQPPPGLVCGCQLRFGSVHRSDGYWRR